MKVINRKSFARELDKRNEEFEAMLYARRMAKERKLARRAARKGKAYNWSLGGGLSDLAALLAA